MILQVESRHFQIMNRKVIFLQNVLGEEVSEVALHSIPSDIKAYKLNSAPKLKRLH